MSSIPANILITRPIQSVEPLASILRDHGYNVLVEPIFSVRQSVTAQNHLEKAMKNRHLQAIIVTSANAIRVLARISKIRTIPIITVGNTTRHVAQKYGFKTVHSAARDVGGNVKTLIPYIKKHLNIAGGTLLYISGRTLSADLKGSLENDGFDVQQVILYETLPLEHFSSEIRDDFIYNQINAILFFSKRSASTFMDVAKRDNLVKYLQPIHAICLSEQIQKALPQACWAGTHHAHIPTRDAVVELLGEIV